MSECLPMCVVALVCGMMASAALGQGDDAAARGKETSSPAAAAGGFVPFVLPPQGVPAEPDLRRVFDGPRGDALPRVAVEGGHFVADGRRVRFWGVNLCFGACFPSHEAADRLAARLAAFGVNCVRFHHMDHHAWPTGLWKKDFSGLEPEALDRLDYLLAALKREGVYANINLHVSRDFSRTGAAVKPEELTEFGKIVCLFDPELIELQKRYARDVLGHRNAYTKLTYAEDPVVALVELSNENSALLAQSAYGRNGFSPRYERLLGDLWNAWLCDRYDSDNALREAWAVGELPRGPEMLAGGADLTRDVIEAHWRLGVLDAARMTAEPVERQAGQPHAVRLNVQAVTDTAWHLQFMQPGLTIRKGRFYSVRMLARADASRSIHVVAQQHDAPWETLGLSEQVTLTDTWRPVELGFEATADCDNARLSVSVGQATGAVDLAEISLTPGGRTGLGERETLTKRNVAMVRPDDLAAEGRRRDWAAFLTDLDLRYFTGMRQHLIKELGVKAAVTGTAGWTAPGDWVQSHLDFVDSHAYWQHPHFPNRPWDERDWVIGNTPMADEPQRSTLVTLARHRVMYPDNRSAARPFTVTEYNHSAPSEYQAEGVPMIASFAAAQDWDGVFLFAYRHGADWDNDYVRGFFDIAGNPVKMAQMAAGALMFRRGDIPELPVSVVTALSPERMLRLAGRYGVWSDRVLDAAGATPEAIFFGRYSVAMFDMAGSSDTHLVQPGNEFRLPPLSPERGPWSMTTAGDVLRWTAAGPRTGLYTARGARSVAVVGSSRGRPQRLGPVTVEIDGPDFAAVTVSSLDGQPLEMSGRMLVTACARMENTDQQWNEARTSVGDRWGKAPTRIEPVRATIRLESQAAAIEGYRLHALDGTGTSVKEWAAERAEGGAWTIRLPGDPGTLWYLIVTDRSMP
ncbi:MAG TPA: carbohydrate binding domain-containing protein [Phycisphaerae bacterium]|nr:carbohydrate binding domain-containing protein [Phycisphaerae bacterium]